MSQPTATQQMSQIGRRGYLEIESFVVPVEVVDSKLAWNQVRLLVKALGGASGEQWVTEARMRFAPVCARHGVLEQLGSDEIGVCSKCDADGLDQDVR